MLAKCANPICGAHFRYLNQGRIFNVPVYESETRASSGPQRIEHFWLCSTCYVTLTLVVRNGKAEVQPRFPQLTDGLAPRAPEQMLSPQSRSIAA